MRYVIFVMLVIFAFCAIGAAQTPSAPGNTMPNFNLKPPRALSGDWWRDPEIANELHLTDIQKKQLEQASLNMKLSLISAAANGASAVIKAESALNTDSFDEPMYDQQVNAAADAAAKLIKDVGGTMLTMRKILTPEQWRKLNAMRSMPRAQAQRQQRRWEQQGNQRP